MMLNTGKAVLAAVLTAALPMASQAATQSFQVHASQNSLAVTTNDATPLDTGIVLQVGDTLDITATGIWNGGGCGLFDANGTLCYGIDPVTGINYFSLIGKIGTNDDADATWFKIGTSYSGTAARAGTLYLAFLDTDSYNNSGFVTANVTAVPEVGTWAMLLAGLAGVGALAHRRRQPGAA